MDPVDQAIGKRLRFFRKLKGLSQSELGDMIGVSRMKIGQFEKGVSSVPSSKLFLISKSFGIEVDRFFDPAPIDYPDHLMDQLDDQVALEAIQILKSLTAIDDPTILKKFSSVLERYAHVLKEKKVN